MKPEEAGSLMPTVNLEIFLPHSPEFVWQALTDPQALAKWLLPNTFKPLLGHRFRFLNRTAESKRQKVHCQVVELDAPHRLAYTWRAEDEEIPTLVTWTLEPVEEGTYLHLEHIGPETSCVLGNRVDFIASSLVRFLSAGAREAGKRFAARQPSSLLSSVSSGRRPMGRIVLKSSSRTLRCIGRLGRALDLSSPIRHKEDSPCIR